MQTERRGGAVSDKYRCFMALAEFERDGVDFRICCQDRQSQVVIVAPHGGGIEPGTSEICRAIAGDEVSFYVLEGTKEDGNRDLHIRSERFDEPRCIALVESSAFVVAIHGEERDESAVFLGGLDHATGGRIKHSLEERGFNVLRPEDARIAGEDPSNICNRGRSKMGVQLEISLGLRKGLFASLDREGRKNPTPQFNEFVDAVGSALAGD